VRQQRCAWMVGRPAQGWACRYQSAMFGTTLPVSGPLNRSDQNSSQGLALIVFNGRLFMAWRRVENEQLSWASTPDGEDWDSPYSRVDFNSSQGPALAASPF
jgi:hypothetical protein